MSLKVIDIRCGNCRAVSEVMTKDIAKESYPCPRCNAPATRIPSAPPFQLEGVSGAFPTAADRWANDHERAAKRAP